MASKILTLSLPCNIEITSSFNGPRPAKIKKIFLSSTILTLSAAKSTPFFFTNLLGIKTMKASTGTPNNFRSLCFSSRLTGANLSVSTALCITETLSSGY
jgi:hypothetical protein